LSESLDWGRWSSFNQRKYIEEAERYSQPGSVAQKKAFFEARYKKAAHLRQSIALMQHTASSGSNDFDRESVTDCCYSKDDSVSRGREECTVDSFYSANGDSLNFDSREEEGEVEVQKGEEAGHPVEDSGFLGSCSEKIAIPDAPEKQPLQVTQFVFSPHNKKIKRQDQNMYWKYWYIIRWGIREHLFVAIDANEAYSIKIIVLKLIVGKKVLIPYVKLFSGELCD
jgi:hypothetical protein